MNKEKLSQEEKTLLDTVESGEYESYANHITQKRT